MLLPVDRSRRPVGTRLLVAFAAEHGVPAAQVLAGTGLLAAALEDPDTVLDPAQEQLAFRNAVRRLGDAPGLGAALGRRFSLANHGDLGFAVMTRATGREAVALAVRFLGASDALVRFTARTADGDVALELDASGLPPELRPFALERDVAAVCAVVGLILPGARLRVALALPPERVAAVAAAAPEHDVRPGPSSAIFVDRAQLDRPLPNADVGAARTFEQRLVEGRWRAAPGTGLAAPARAAILDALPVRASAAKVARSLHVAPRTLRRRLEAEGTSFQTVADETLCDLAGDLLRHGLPVTEVAARLGYAEAASFTRAFRRWTGTTPRAWARSES